FLGFSVLTIASAFVVKILHGNSETYGLLLSASGAGALIGVLFVVPIAQAAHRTGLILIATSAWMGTWFIVLASTTVIAVANLSIFMFSIGAPTVITMALGLIQVLAPPNMRARLVTVFIMITFGMQPVASVLVGLSAETLSIPTAILINGVLFVIGAAAMFLFRPELRHWSANQHSAAALQVAKPPTADAVSEISKGLEI
ncbi:MAG TPA: MFS transporter, partial [Anaerolineae bacterium]|nr:MFS transporter [Anaerolineae bacterium]